MDALETSIHEVLRLPSPAPQPQALAHDGEHLWLGSWATRRIYGIDPRHGTVIEEANAPGQPVGGVCVGDELRFVLRENGDANNRFIRRFLPGHGFKDRDVVPCPDDTGSFLAFDGSHLWLSQRHNRRVLELDASYAVKRTLEIALAEIVGIVWVGEVLYLSLWYRDERACRIARMDRAEGSTVVPIANVPFAGISLTHDGTHFWANDFKENAIVAFTL
ncbi:MAG: hypothetical protein M1314_01295 [Firmicutes bacterium]|nr:hypothetical protein [Bacillota bacterium]